MATQDDIYILGAGPAGLALAVQLLRRKDLQAGVTVVERENLVGGLAASFEHDGLIFDYGSHRLHPAASAEIIEELHRLLGSDLLDRPRNGRIRLQGRYVKFPLRPTDLFLHLPPKFVMGCMSDMLRKCVGRKSSDSQAASFADVLMAGLGKTMCNEFYFPYAEKLWGLSPRAISPVQALRRVSANSPTRVLKKVLSLMPGFKKKGAGRFFYPRHGFGQISEALAEEVRRLGGCIRLGATVEQIRLDEGRVASLDLASTDGRTAAGSGASESLPGKFVFSTIPAPLLMRLLRPAIPAELKETCAKLRYRAMVLHYLVLQTPQFTPYDAHYFPGREFLFSRLSEPKNYSVASEPAQWTGLCAEIPCQQGDSVWNASESELTKRVVAELAKADLPVQCPVRSAFVRRLPQAYPVYDLEYAERFQAMDAYLGGLQGLITLGRQGLFAHDNTHHTIEMGWRASECLRADFTWNAERWQACRKEFDGHVVED